MVIFFINCRFSYCPLIWMFTSKGCNKRINRIHERSLRLILSDYEPSFDDMLSTLNEKTIHQCCINVLLTEVYKYLNGFSRELMNEVFYLRQNHYNLRNLNVFVMDNHRFMLKSTVYREKKTITNITIWSKRLSIKTWRCEGRQCQICSRCLASVDYL